MINRPKKQAALRSPNLEVLGNEKKEKIFLLKLRSTRVLTPSERPVLPLGQWDQIALILGPVALFPNFRTSCSQTEWDSILGKQLARARDRSDGQAGWSACIFGGPQPSKEASIGPSMQRRGAVVGCPASPLGSANRIGHAYSHSCARAIVERNVRPGVTYFSIPSIHFDNALGSKYGIPFSILLRFARVSNCYRQMADVSRLSRTNRSVQAMGSIGLGGSRGGQLRPEDPRSRRGLLGA